MFIVFDGIDGAGKTTHLKLLSEWLKDNKIDHLKMREPGGSDNSEIIRKIFLETKFDPLSQLLLISAARKENMKFLKKNKEKLIICDRFVDATYAYQGLFLDHSVIDYIVKLSVSIYPDYVFLFLNQYSQKKDNYFDVLAQNKQNSVIEIFKSRINKNYILVPNLDINSQQEFIRKEIEKILKKQLL